MSSGRSFSPTSRAALLVVGAMLLASCGSADATTTSSAPTGGSVTRIKTTTATPSTSAAPPPVTLEPTTTTPATPAPSITPAPATTEPIPDPSFSEAQAAFDRLASDNTAASMTVMRGGSVVFSQASGTTIDGQPATADSPMLVASVSKLITGFMIARLAGQGRLDVTAPFPWSTIGVTPDPGWNDVTVREFLDHTSGMPVARESWFVGNGECRTKLPGLVASAPEGHRGQWKYSNGNYCALGLLVEALTAETLDVAAQRLVFDPVGAQGVHLSTNGLLPGDLPHAGDVDRLTPLGGAGVFIVSTDDMAAVLSSTMPQDREVLLPPGVFTDQYGWGHTGTVIGAISCAWVMEAGRTVVVATIAGNNPDKGGAICDRVVPPVANAIGIGRGTPDRTP